MAAAYARLGAGCMFNCSNNGECLAGSCVCGREWFGSICNEYVDRDHSIAYQTYRIGFTIAFCIVGLAAAWRTIAALHFKYHHRYHHNNHSQRRHRIFDTQVVTLLLMTISMPFAIGTILDPFPALPQYVERVTGAVCQLISTGCLLLSYTLSLRIFIAIQAGFHAPSRTVLKGIDIFSALALLACIIVGIILVVGGAPRVDPLVFAYRLVMGFWLLVIIAGLAIYSLTLLRTLLKRTQRGTSRSNDLIRLSHTMRAAQVEAICGLIIYFIAYRVTGQSFRLSLTLESLVKVLQLLAGAQQVWLMVTSYIARA
jgi:hypothetical protein